MAATDKNKAAARTFEVNSGNQHGYWLTEAEAATQASAANGRAEALGIKARYASEPYTK